MSDAELYRAKTANTNLPPASHPEAWEKLAQPSDDRRRPELSVRRIWRPIALARRDASSEPAMPRPNFFLAFPIDGQFVLGLPEMPRFMRLFQPEDVHVTLAFLGGCGEDGAERALAVLDEQLKNAPLSPIDISLGEVVPMGGSRRTYSALSALLETGRAEATTCLSALRDPLTEAATGRRDKRPPKPHVTIARPRGRAADADREAGLAWAAQLDLRAVHAKLDRIALYTWSEVRRERLFRIIAERRVA